MKQSGYTIIELLIYLAVFGLLSVVLINTVLLTGRAFRDARVSRAGNAAAGEALERMIREIRFADSLDEGASVFDASPGILKLNSIDPFTETAQTITFALNGGRITIKKNTEAPVDLTPSNIAVTNFVFRRVVSDKSQAVKIEITVGGVNFFSSAILRRSY